MGTERAGGAEDGTEVARVGDGVERDDEWRLVGRGGGVEQVVDGAYS